MSESSLTETTLLQCAVSVDAHWEVTNVEHVVDKKALTKDYLRLSLTMGGPNAVPADKLAAMYKPYQVLIPMIGWKPSYLTYFRTALLGLKLKHCRKPVPFTSKPGMLRILVQPFQALRLLCMGHCQRALSLEKIEEFIHIIRTGKWSPFSTGRMHRNNWLSDSKHRLWSCVITGVPVEMWFMYGHGDDDVQALDTGKRTTQDHLHISSSLAEARGETAAVTKRMPPLAKVGGIVKVMFEAIGLTTGTVAPTPKIEAMLREWRAELEWLGPFYKQTSANVVAQRLHNAPVAAAFLVYERRCRKFPAGSVKRLAATRCLKDIVEGVSGNKGSATHRLTIYLTLKNSRDQNKSSDATKDRAVDIFWKVLGLLDKHFKGERANNVCAPRNQDNLLAEFVALGPVGKGLVPEDLADVCQKTLWARLRQNRVEDVPTPAQVPLAKHGEDVAVKTARLQA